MFQAFFALGRDGRTDAQGAPTFLQLIAMSRHFEIYDGRAPVWLQRFVGVLLEPLAHALGYRADYVSSETRAMAAAPVTVGGDASS